MIEIKNKIKIYHDTNGNNYDIDILQMVQSELKWAVNRIEEGEAAIQELSKIKSTIEDASITDLKEQTYRSKPSLNINNERVRVTFSCSLRRWNRIKQILKK